MTQVSNLLLHASILEDFEYALFLIFPLNYALET